MSKPIGMYSTRLINPHVADSYLTIDDPYVKPKPKLLVADCQTRVTGRQFQTNPAKKNGNIGTLPRLFMYTQGEPYSDHFTNGDKDNAKLGFGTKAERASEFTNFIRQEQYRTQIKREMKVVEAATRKLKVCKLAFLYFAIVPPFQLNQCVQSRDFEETEETPDPDSQNPAFFQTQVRMAPQPEFFPKSVCSTLCLSLNRLLHVQRSLVDTVCRIILLTARWAAFWCHFCPVSRLFFMIPLSISCLFLIGTLPYVCVLNGRANEVKNM